MSAKLLERWLDSVDRLLLYYLGRVEATFMTNCPLCWAECEKCLWAIIEGTHCEDFARKLYPGKDDPGPSYLRRNPKFIKWKKVRAIQLARWRCIIVGELATRYVKGRKKCKDTKK